MFFNIREGQNEPLLVLGSTGGPKCLGGFKGLSFQLIESVLVNKFYFSSLNTFLQSTFLTILYYKFYNIYQQSSPSHPVVLSGLR